jgi:hypothetical protein
MSALRQVFTATALLLLLGTAEAQAQKLTLLIPSGSPVAFPNATEADYDNATVNATTGSVTATAPLAYSLDLLGGGGGGVSRTGSLSIRASTATMGGTKPIGDLQWRRSDLGTWNDMTTTNVTVQSNTMVRNTTNDPYTNSIVFRVKLNWGTDGPATYTPTIILTATLTTP